MYVCSLADGSHVKIQPEAVLERRVECLGEAAPWRGEGNKRNALELD